VNTLNPPKSNPRAAIYSAMVILLESIVGRGFFAILIFTSILKWGMPFAASLVQLIAFSSLLYVVFSAGRASYYSTVLNKLIVRQEDSGLSRRIISLISSSLVQSIISIMLLYFIYALGFVTFDHSNQIPPDIAVLFVVFTAFSKNITERSLFLAYGVTAQYSFVDTLLKLFALIAIIFASSEIIALVVIATYQIPLTPIIIMSNYYEEITSSSYFKKVTAASLNIRLFRSNLSSFLSVLRCELGLLRNAAPFAVGDFLITIYTSLPLALSGFYCSPSQIIKLTVLLKISEAAQQVISPLSRTAAIEYLKQSRHPTLYSMIAFLNTVFRQLLADFLRIISPLLRISPSLLKHHAYLFYIVFSSLSVLTVIVMTLLRHHSHYIFSWGAFFSNLGIDNLFSITSFPAAAIEIFLVLLVLLTVVSSVFLSTYCDLVYRGYSPLPTVNLYAPPIAGIITMSVGLVISFFFNRPLTLFVFHGISELTVCIVCLIRARYSPKLSTS